GRDIKAEREQRYADSRQSDPQHGALNGCVEGSIAAWRKRALRGFNSGAARAGSDPAGLLSLPCAATKTRCAWVGPAFSLSARIDAAKSSQRDSERGKASSVTNRGAA